MSLDSTILIGIATLSLTVIGFIWQSTQATNSRLRALEIEIEHLKNNENRQDHKFDQLLGSIIEVKDAVNDLKVELQNKADR